jgi:hypothetical protein
MDRQEWLKLLENKVNSILKVTNANKEWFELIEEDSTLQENSDELFSISNLNSSLQISFNKINNSLIVSLDNDKDFAETTTYDILELHNEEDFDKFCFEYLKYFLTKDDSLGNPFDFIHKEHCCVTLPEQNDEAIEKTVLLFYIGLGDYDQTMVDLENNVLFSNLIYGNAYNLATAIRSSEKATSQFSAMFSNSLISFHRIKKDNVGAEKDSDDETYINSYFFIEVEYYKSTLKTTLSERDYDNKLINYLVKNYPQMPADLILALSSYSSLNDKNQIIEKIKKDGFDNEDIASVLEMFHAREIRDNEIGTRLQNFEKVYLPYAKDDNINLRSVALYSGYIFNSDIVVKNALEKGVIPDLKKWYDKKIKVKN